jgi:eukaryotic-like serine/threonine-protein kinase
MEASASVERPQGVPPTPGGYGDYQLLRRIGRGAMGEVWLARHTRTGGIAALKLLRDVTGRSHERMQRFFSRERRAVSRLSHPNVV